MLLRGKFIALSVVLKKRKTLKSMIQLKKSMREEKTLNSKQKKGNKIMA